MEKHWIYREEPKKEIVESLSKSINVNPYLTKILVQRGITEFDEAKKFFRPSLNMLFDPFMMKGMDKAVNRLCDAVFRKEKIMLYGDYDVDGTTSVSLLFLFLSQFTDQVSYYIPDRYSEGYGISRQGVDKAKDENCQLIIALDCGIRALDRAEQAKSYGIDLIICDHHLPGALLPDAYAILDPKQSDCGYPFKELSGCGVGFKLLEGFCQQNTIAKEKLYSYMDLLAVSIASDLVPMQGENRVLTYYGLRKLNQSPSAGLKSLMEVSGKNKELNVSDVVFRLGPRINAAGRLAHANESVKLLIGAGAQTDGYADVLNERNSERKLFDQSMTREALRMIEEQEEDKVSTVLFQKEWHKGVIGIVASRCIEHYYRPTIILTESNGKATGSARSVDGFDVHEALTKCEDLLEQYGGHKYAAGLTLSLDRIDAFRARFEDVVSKSITEDQKIPKVNIDVELPLRYVNFKTNSIIAQMEPFGPQNMTPTFGTKNVFVKSIPQILKEEHAKGYIFEGNGDKSYEWIGFGLAEKAKKIKPNHPFQIAYHIEENNFMQQRSIILNVKDIKFD